MDTFKFAVVVLVLVFMLMGASYGCLQVTSIIVSTMGVSGSFAGVLIILGGMLPALAFIWALETCEDE